MNRLFILFYVSTYDYDKTWAFIVGLMEENKAFVLDTVFKNHQKCSKFSNIYFVNLKWLDGVQVKNMVEKGENTCHWSKISLHKNFKLGLQLNVTNETYLYISCRSQKCYVQYPNLEFYLVTWILFSKVSNLNETFAIFFSNCQTSFISLLIQNRISFVTISVWSWSCYISVVSTPNF